MKKRTRIWCALQWSSTQSNRRKQNQQQRQQKEIQMDTSSGIISLECVGHQEKIEFTMSQITTTTIHMTAKSFLLWTSTLYFHATQTRLNGWIQFFLHRYRSVSFSCEMTNISLLQAQWLPFPILLTHCQRVSKLRTGVAVIAEQLTNMN